MPDAFELSEEAFIEQAEKNRGAVKSWLMNLKNIASISNVSLMKFCFIPAYIPKAHSKTLT